MERTRARQKNSLTILVDADVAIHLIVLAPMKIYPPSSNFDHGPLEERGGLTVDVIDDGLFDFRKARRVVRLTHELGYPTHRPRKETHPTDQVQMQLASVRLRSRVIVHPAR